MLRIVVAAIYMAAWGVVGVIYGIRNGALPPAEYWTLPAIGLGGFLAAVSSLSDKKSNKDKPDNDDSTAKESP